MEVTSVDKEAVDDSHMVDYRNEQIRFWESDPFGTFRMHHQLLRMDGNEIDTSSKEGYCGRLSMFDF